MKILVTGTEGYLGSLLAPLLLERGHHVLAVDTGFYKDGCLFHGVPASPRTLNKDLRHIVPEDLQGIEAVAHLAELSNDPAGELSPQITYDINHAGSVRLAKLARAAGAARFVYTSSCSVYGVAAEEIVNEESAVAPQTAYAKCKVLVERDVHALAGDSFSPVFLRNATAYGASPRMRFDIVLNNLCGWAWTTRQIRMNSDGTPWRPLVHALDICQAIVAAVEAPREAVHNQIFNVGEDAGNLRVRAIAEVVAEVFAGCTLHFGPPDKDQRSYRVSFAKIAGHLPAFRCRWTPRDGACQLRRVFENIQLSRELFEARSFTRLKQLQHLIATRQIDERFFWRLPDSAALALPSRADGAST